MNSAQALDVARESLVVTIKIGGPLMAIALVVGLIISLVQALTQIQETTLTFVPKILILFASILFLLPFMLATLTDFTHGLFDQMIALDQ